MLTALFAPFLSTFRAKLGLRQMIQARYSFGKDPVIVPLVLNMATLMGYAILGSTLGGHLARIRTTRVVYTVALTAIIIPLSMKEAAEFLTSSGNFVGIIGYWPACFVSVTLVEHVVIRKGGMENYDLDQWDTVNLLPTGIPALAASICSLGLVISDMSQTWFAGPIVLHIGDIGFERAFVVTGLLYVPFRLIEVRVRGHS